MTRSFPILSLSLTVALAAVPGGCHKQPSKAPTEQTIRSNEPLAAHHQTVRKNYPYYVQGVFVADVGGNEALVLVTEPPPNIDVTDLQRALESAPGQIFTQSVGADGWVKDIGFVVQHEGDADLADRLARVANVLHGTSYGFAPMPVIPPAPSNDLSIDIGAPTLGALLETETFTQMERPMSAQQLLARGVPGLALGDQTVAFVLPDGSDLCSMQVELRKFAVESDLILGAETDGDTTLILARKRRVAHGVLPPLRVETILSLGAADFKEVGQSFERHAIPAGIVPGTLEAWAPIYLSDNVIDTEFGGLLNITDQMLKSWSLGGKIDYRNFDYPPPQPWPLNQDLHELLGADSIVFNWNTGGASMLLVDSNARGMLAMSRGGSLPMQYNPDQPTFASDLVEGVAYEYFAGLNNPLLARVVQYTAVNQALQLSQARATCVRLPVLDTAAPLVPHVHRALVAVQQGTYDLTAAVEAFAEQSTPELVEAIERQLESAGVDAKALTDDEKLTVFLGVFVISFAVDLEPLSPAELQELAVLLSNREALDSASPRALQLSLSVFENSLYDLILRLSMDTKAIIAEYEQSNHASTNPWIKTPRSVYSQDLRDGWVGGHNISPNPRRLVVLDRSVKPNKIGFDPEEPDIVRINPKDADKLGSIARDLDAENLHTGDIQTKLASASPAGPKPISTSTTPPARSAVLGHGPSLASAPGWIPMESQPHALSPELGAALDASARRGRVGMYVERQGAAYHATVVTTPGRPRHIESGSTEGLVERVHHDLLANGTGLDVYFGRDFEQPNVSAMHHTLELRHVEATLRGQRLVGDHSTAVIKAEPRLLEPPTTTTTLGATETRMKLNLATDGAPSTLELNVRSSRDAAVQDWLRSLMPKNAQTKTIDELVNDLERRAVEEGVRIDVNVLLDKTSVDRDDSSYAI